MNYTIEDNKIKALLRLYYLDLFCTLENKIKDIFKQEIIDIDGLIKHKLYFFYGSHKSKEYSDFSLDKLVRKEKDFKSNESFSDFTLIEVIRILNKNPIIDKFNFNTHSLTRKTISYPFYDTIIKLIKMRNVLAHESINSSFKDEYIVENLSIDALLKNNSFYFYDYDISKMGINDRYILSNLIYMNSILFQLILR